jgi:hypothetical protein
MKVAFKTPLMALGLVTVLGCAGAASADTWRETHPRRVEVNHRLANQNHRITAERREGELSRHQARVLRHEDHDIRRQERADAARHGGHITRSEQIRLNHEENRASEQIGR